MTRTTLVVGIIFIFHLLFARQALGEERAIAKVTLPQQAVRVRMLYHSVRGITPSQARATCPQALAILTGGFYAEGKSLSPAGLVIWYGRCLQRPSIRLDRPAIALTATGKVVLSTARKIFRDRKLYLFAIECGPFLWSGGALWTDFRGFDASFCRATAPRVALGLTKSGKLFWARGRGTPSGFQTALLADFRRQTRGESIATVALLDGGTSCLPWIALPTRIVVERVPGPALARR